MLSGNPHTVAGPRVAADTRVPVLDRKCPEPAQFDAVPASQSCRNLVEDRGYDDIEIALIQVRVGFGQLLYELRFSHRRARALLAKSTSVPKPPTTVKGRTLYLT